MEGKGGKKAGGQSSLLGLLTAGNQGSAKQGTALLQQLASQRVAGEKGEQELASSFDLLRNSGLLNPSLMSTIGGGSDSDANKRLLSNLVTIAAATAASNNASAKSKSSSSSSGTRHVGPRSKTAPMERLDSVDTDGGDNNASGDGTRRRSRSKSSNYRGVSRCAKDGRWQARIRIGRSVKYLGRYKTEMDAAKRYDIAARQYHGNRAVLNFADIVMTFEDLDEGDKGPESKSDEEMSEASTPSGRGRANSAKRAGEKHSPLHNVKKRRASAAVPPTKSMAGVAVRRNSLPPLTSSLHSMTPGYIQLLAQLHTLGAVGLREKNVAEQENRLPALKENVFQGGANPLMLGLTSGMLAGTAQMYEVPSDAAIASQLSPASKNMTGAISGLISLKRPTF